MAYLSNEVGHAAGRGRIVVARDEADRVVSDLAGHPMTLPVDAVMTHGPETCPACGALTVQWGCDPDGDLREPIHPLVWHDTEWMADSFICLTCDAGWIEPDRAEPITWVRPYWQVGERA